MVSLNLLVITMFVVGPYDWLTLLFGINFLVELSAVCLDDAHAYREAMLEVHYDDDPGGGVGVAGG